MRAKRGLRRADGPVTDTLSIRKREKEISIQ